MSSFICDPKHFNSIEEGLNSLIRFDRDFHCYGLKKDFPVLYGQKDHDETTVFNEVKSLVDELRGLNVVCVSLQYKHHYENIDIEISEQMEAVNERKGFVSLDKTALYKALRCVCYQIEVGHLEELEGVSESQKRSLNFLDIMMDYLAHDIATNTPQYEAAKWEII